MARQADRAHRLAQQRLSDAVERRLAALLLALPDPREQRAMDAYNAVAAPTVAGGQRQAAQLAIGYLAAVAPPTKAASLDRALDGVLVNAASAVARSPVLRLWSLLDDGLDEREAREAAGSYAGGLATNDLKVAQYGGLEEGARVSGGRVRGWRKEVHPGCCEWCRVVSGESVGRVKVYKRADTVSFHDRDRCSAAPVLRGE